MRNTYFRFKRFTIEQDRCAMKVSTDACILGAWTSIDNDVKSVLDIGMGTGLLSLMLAQRNRQIQIDGIEIDATAYTQANENIQSSAWADRIKVHQGNVNNISLAKKYDLIICNPPFFNKSLLGPNEQRNAARHTISLSYEQLLAAIEKNLAAEGDAFILLPYVEGKELEALLINNGWHVNNRLHIHPRVNAAPNRIIIACSKRENKKGIEELYIKDESNNYTERFKELMSPYYLAL